MKKFSNAVFYVNNSEFKQGSPDEQNIAVACKVLIQNAIVLWNYLYLSQLLANCSVCQATRSSEITINVPRLLRHIQVSVSQGV